MDGLSPISTSPLNTAYKDLDGSDKDILGHNSDEDKYGIPSYQPPKPSARGENGENTTKAKKRRKANEALPTTIEAKIKKTESSIAKVKEHSDKKPCPKSLRYSASANILADELFMKVIASEKEKAQRGFVKALTRYHYRRLEKQKTKVHKENAKASRKTSSFLKDSD